MTRKTFFKSIVLGLIFLPAWAAAGEYDGTWTATVHEHSSSCQSIGRDIEGDYTAIIRQKDDGDLSFTVQETGTVFQGVEMENTGDAHRIHLVASYRKEAGIISQNMNIDMLDNNRGKGSTAWYWSDGLMVCGGHYSFTLERRK